MINKQTDIVPIRTVKAKNLSKLMKGYAHVERREVMNLLMDYSSAHYCIVEVHTVKA
jgi:hypothetical protein